jgi:hypothetical protein
MNTKRRKHHTPKHVVRKLRDAETMLNAGKPFLVLAMFPGERSADAHFTASAANRCKSAQIRANYRAP